MLRNETNFRSEQVSQHLTSLTSKLENYREEARGGKNRQLDLVTNMIYLQTRINYLTENERPFVTKCVG